MSRYGAVNRRRRRATCAPTVIPFRRRRGRGGARVAGMFGGGRDCTRISADDRYGTRVCVCDCAISVFFFRVRVRIISSILLLKYCWSAADHVDNNNNIILIILYCIVII